MKSRRILTLVIAAALILPSFATVAAASGVMHREEWLKTHPSTLEKTRKELEAKANAPETEAPETDAEGNEVEAPAPSEITVPLSIAEPLPEKNVLKGSDFNEMSSLGHWQANTQTVTWEEDENGGYIKCSGIIKNYQGFNYVPEGRPDAGKYKITGYIRCATPGEITNLRMYVYWGEKSQLFWLHPTSEEWLKFEAYVETTTRLTKIYFCGGMDTIYTQPYCFDNISIEPVDEIPADAPTVFGTSHKGEDVIAASLAAAPKYDAYDKAAEDAAGYEIQGIMINQDADGTLGGLDKVTDQDIVDFAKQFKDTHVTDYVICLNNTLASFPSDTWEDVVDKYYKKEENGIAVDYSAYYAGPYHIYEALDSDYFGRLVEGFREVGIKTWLSMRINDVHDHSYGIKTSKLLSEFYWEHPETYRVQNNRTTQRSYWNQAYDYTHRIIQERLLSLFNDALNRYDVNGIEIDFLRDVYLWYFGGEYNGLDIFNELMRELRDLVAVYEEKYGHEIEIGVRVLPELESNYIYGLDVMTWVQEDIVDMVCISGEFNSNDNNPPIKLWKSLLAPYDVEFVGCIEQHVSSAPNFPKAPNDFESYNAIAAAYLSQGVDKVYLYNYFLSVGADFDDGNRITTDDNSLGVTSLKQYHNIITTIGSYDKLMTKNRKMITTYSTTFMPWINSQAQLPQSVFPGRTITVQQYVGDIPEGAKVTLKFSLPNEGYKTNPPDALVNGVACTFEDKVVYSPMGLTTRPLYCYDVPAEAWASGSFLIEILPKDYTEVAYVEVYIEPAK